MLQESICQSATSIDLKPSVAGLIARVLTTTAILQEERKRAEEDTSEHRSTSFEPNREEKRTVR